MWRGHGGKVISLTTGDLMDMWKQSMKHGRNKVCHEKSAEAVVPGNLNLIYGWGIIKREGPNLKK
jgi:hypothetical protein